MIDAGTAMLSQLVKSTIENTSAHGLSRAVSDKGWLVRVFWLLLFCTSFGLFMRSFLTFVKQLNGRDVSTSLNVNSIDFDYPDLYFCWDAPLSGSYYLSASDAILENVTKTFQAVDAVFNSRCNGTNNIISCYKDYLSITKYLAKVHSLEYKLLIDKFARRLEQSVLLAEMGYDHGGFVSSQRLQLKEFYHPSYLRCFYLKLSDAHRQILKSSINRASGVHVTLMLDQPFEDHLFNSNTPTVSDMFGQPQIPAYWSLSPVPLLTTGKLPSVRLYLTPRNEYPSHFVKNILLNAGNYYTISLEMRVTEFDAEQFKGECVSSDSPVQFVNPLNGSAQNFSYSYSHCYFSAMNKATAETARSSLAYNPIAWPSLNLSSLWDVLNNNELFSQMTSSSIDANEYCRNAHPCKRITYSMESQSHPWPSSNDLFEILTLAKLRNDSAAAAGVPVPALEKLLYLGNFESNSTKLRNYLSSNLLRLHLTSSRKSADLTRLSLAYSFDKFVADTGGTLGVYLGMSLLTLCEVIEFIYSAIVFFLQNNNQISIKDNSKITKKNKTQSGSEVFETHLEIVDSNTNDQNNQSNDKACDPDESN